MSEEKIRVRLSRKLEKKARKTAGGKTCGPALVDPISGITIGPGEQDYDPETGQYVPLTSFVKERIKSGDLSEVRGKAKADDTKKDEDTIDPKTDKSGKKK